MAMSDVLNRPSRPVSGEVYTVREIELTMVDDKFNFGKQRPQLILSTDKGRIFAPSAMARAALEDFEDAKNTLTGAKLVATTYFSSRFNKEVVTLNFA